MLTYRQIKLIIDTMTDEQLDQQAQVMNPDSEDVIPLHPIISLKTVKELVSSPGGEEELQRTRSSFDNEHHPEHFVFLMDLNMFAADGTIAFDLLSGERIYGKNKKKNVGVEDEFNDTFPLE